MKTNELRIGTYVATEGIDFVEVSKIDEDFGICYKIPQEFGQFYPYKEVEPIPLTEEWMMRFGFDKVLPRNDKMYYRLNDDFVIEENNVFLLGDDAFEMLKLRRKIKYVHQLQNLYFALTGEELTIDNEKTK